MNPFLIVDRLYLAMILQTILLVKLLTILILNWVTFLNGSIDDGSDDDENRASKQFNIVILLLKLVLL